MDEHFLETPLKWKHSASDYILELFRNFRKIPISTLFWSWDSKLSARWQLFSHYSTNYFGCWRALFVGNQPYGRWWDVRDSKKYFIIILSPHVLIFQNIKCNFDTWFQFQIKEDLYWRSSFKLFFCYVYLNCKCIFCPTIMYEWIRERLKVTIRL